MKKIYLSSLIIIFHGLTINKLLSSENNLPTIPPFPAPFTIPTIDHSPNCRDQKPPFNLLESPLNILMPTNESEDVKLSIVSQEIEKYSKCPWTHHYEKEEQKKIAEKLLLIRNKITSFHNQSKKRTARIDEYKQQYGTYFTDRMIDEGILVNRIHALQEYKKSAQLKLKMSNT